MLVTQLVALVAPAERALVCLVTVAVSLVAVAASLAGRALQLLLLPHLCLPRVWPCLHQLRHRLRHQLLRWRLLHLLHLHRQQRASTWQPALQPLALIMVWPRRKPMQTLLRLIMQQAQQAQPRPALLLAHLMDPLVLARVRLPVTAGGQLVQLRAEVVAQDMVVLSVAVAWAQTMMLPA